MLIWVINGKHSGESERPAPERTCPYPYVWHDLSSFLQLYHINLSKLSGAKGTIEGTARGFMYMFVDSFFHPMFSTSLGDLDPSSNSKSRLGSLHTSHCQQTIYFKRERELRPVKSALPLPSVDVRLRTRASDKLSHC